MRTGKDKHPHGWGHRNQLSTICYRRKRSELLRDLAPAWPLPRCWLSLFFLRKWLVREGDAVSETNWNEPKQTGWASGGPAVDELWTAWDELWANLWLSCGTRHTASETLADAVWTLMLPMD